MTRIETHDRVHMLRASGRYYIIDPMKCKCASAAERLRGMNMLGQMGILSPIARQNNEYAVRRSTWQFSRNLNVSFCA